MPPGRRGLPSIQPYSPFTTIAEHVMPGDNTITLKTDMLLLVQFTLQASSVRVSACLGCQDAGHAVEQAGQEMLFCQPNTGADFSVCQLDPHPDTILQNSDEHDKKLQKVLPHCTSSVHAGAEHSEGKSCGKGFWRIDCF